MTDTDKIKVLETALQILIDDTSMYTGICDVVGFAVRELNYPIEVREPSIYGIDLPPRKYYTSDGEYLAFSYPCTLEGRQQRIEVLEEAIKKLKVMNQQERTVIINKIIYSQFRGIRMDDIYYNDRFNALNKLSDEELLKQNPELN